MVKRTRQGIPNVPNDGQRLAASLWWYDFAKVVQPTIKRGLRLACMNMQTLVLQLEGP